MIDPKGFLLRPTSGALEPSFAERLYIHHTFSSTQKDLSYFLEVDRIHFFKLFLSNSIGSIFFGLPLLLRAFTFPFSLLSIFLMFLGSAGHTVESHSLFLLCWSKHRISHVHLNPTTPCLFMQTEDPELWIPSFTFLDPIRSTEITGGDMYMWLSLKDFQKWQRVQNAAARCLMGGRPVKHFTLILQTCIAVVPKRWVGTH